MKTLYLVYRNAENYNSECHTGDYWDLVGIVSAECLVEIVKEKDRKQFGEDANVEYTVKEIYTDLKGCGL